MNNHRIDIDGDTAKTEVIWFYLTVDPDTVPTILQAGRYVDDLVRENGQWKIARHDISRIFGRSPMMPAPDTRLDQLTRRVQRLEDQDAIWRLFMTYKHHLDQRDFKAYASLFTDDAEWIGNLGKVIGPAQIEEHAVEDARGVGVRPRAHPSPRAQPGDRSSTATPTRRQQQHWGYVTRSETDASGVADARHLLRRAAAHAGRLEASRGGSPTATSRTSTSPTSRIAHSAVHRPATA